MNNQTQITLPTEAARFLQNLESRNITLSIQKKKSEVGDWRNEFQIRGGAAFGPDWTMLNRFRPHFVRYCEANALVDESFSDLSFERNVPAHEKGPKVETVADMCRRQAMSLKSDERAQQSKEDVKALRQLEKEKAAKERAEKPKKVVQKKAATPKIRMRKTTIKNGQHATMWTKAQDELVCEMYLSDEVWPVQNLPEQKESRKAHICAELAKLGPSRSWASVDRRIKLFCVDGVLNRRLILKSSITKPVGKKVAWTHEQNNYLRVLRWPNRGGSTRDVLIRDEIIATINAMKPSSPRTWKAIKSRRASMLTAKPLTEIELAKFYELNPQLAPDWRLNYERERETARRRKIGMKAKFRWTDEQLEYLKALPKYNGLGRTREDNQRHLERRKLVLKELAMRGDAPCWNTTKDTLTRLRKTVE